MPVSSHPSAGLAFTSLTEGAEGIQENIAGASHVPLEPPAQERGVPTSPSQSTCSLQRRKIPESGQPPVALQFSHLPSPSHQPHCGPRCLALRFGVGWGSPLSSHSSLTPGGVLGAPGLSLPHCSAVASVYMRAPRRRSPSTWMRPSLCGLAAPSVGCGPAA